MMKVGEFFEVSANGNPMRPDINNIPAKDPNQKLR
jgi:hypothetical protein